MEYAHEHDDVASSASWLYWVAALTVANVTLLFMNASFGFAIGMAFVDLLVFAAQDGFIPMFLAVSMCIGIGLFIAFLGYMGTQRAKWAFIVGILLVLLDTAFLLLDPVNSIISLVFHGWVLFSLIKGAITLFRE